MIRMTSPMPELGALLSPRGKGRIGQVPGLHLSGPSACVMAGLG